MGSTNQENKSRTTMKSNLEASEEVLEKNKLMEGGEEIKNTPQKKVTAKIDIVGANARVRTNSECSTGSPISPSISTPKKRRTVVGTSPIQNFIFPGVPPSPPKFMSLEEVMKAANGVSNMVLAHEIAVDKNFKLEKFEPPANSLEKRVQETMHRAFWDNMREQLAQEPRVYSQTFVLLQEVRDNLLDHVILPHQTKIRQEITEKFDVDLIKQQAVNGVLNFHEYSQYVLSLLARHCAPVRDEAIAKLKQLDDPVEIFRGVMEVLDLMRLDMANFTITQIRPQVIAQSVEYERKKFSEFLETQNDGLEITRHWLTKNITQQDIDSYQEVSARSLITKITARSYLNLLSWPSDKLLPETIVLDGSRIYELGDRLRQICIIGSILLVTMSSLASKVQNPEVLKKKLKKNMCIILDSAASEEETLKLMDNAIEQVISDVTQYSADNSAEPAPASAVTALKAQLMQIKSPEQRVRQLITTRAEEFIESLLNTTSKAIQVPMGLTSLQEELAHVCGTLLRIVSHNRDVFGSYYADIITKYIKNARSLKNQKNLDIELDID